MYEYCYSWYRPDGIAVNINISLIALALAEGLVFVKGNNIDPSIFVKIFNSAYFKTAALVSLLLEMSTKRGLRYL